MMMTTPPTPTPTTTTTTTKKRLADDNDDDNDNDDDDLRCSVFPRSSTTLITCASNSGKTWFLRQVMLNREVFIEAGKKIRRVVYVNCNQRDTQFSHPWEDAEEEEDDEEDDEDEDDDDNDLKKKNEEEEEEEEEEENLIDLVSVGLHDLAGTREDLFDLVQPGDVVILDDLQTLTKSVEHLVNYGAHHYQLVVFLVTQSCLGSPLYSLLKSVHNLVLLFANNSASSLARHVKSTFFLSSDTRSCLEDIFAHAEKTKSTVVLKINSVATSPFHRSVLAFSGVENLFAEQQKQRAGAGASAQRGEVTTFPFCAVYVETKYREDMLQASRTRKVRLPAAAGFASDEAFVLVPLQNVQVGKNDDDDDDDDEEDRDDNDVDDDGSPKKKKKKVCLRRQWDEMNRQLESEIETGFDFAKWNVAKNLMREVLKCPQVCISSDFRLAYVDRQEFSIIDFLQVATRKSGPGEVTASAARGSRRRPAPRDFVASFVPLLAVLLANHAPVSYVKNKRLHALTLNYMQSHRRRRRVPQ